MLQKCFLLHATPLQGEQQWMRLQMVFAFAFVFLNERITCYLFSTQILPTNFPRDAAGAEQFPLCRSLLLLAIAAQST